MKKPYWVYMLECAGGFIYTGIAIDPDARFREHLAGRGSRFTRMRKPSRIIGMRLYPDRGEALRSEHALKKLKPGKKREWAAASDRPSGSRKKPPLKNPMNPAGGFGSP